MAQWTLITVTYNSAEKLAQYWRGVPPSNIEWIVVDNASTDDTLAVARRLGARVIPLPSNVGFGAANNHGFGSASHDLVGFVNPDVTVDFASLDHFAEIVAGSSVLTSPQLRGDDDQLQPNGRGLPTVWSKVANRLFANLKGERPYLLFSRPGESQAVCWFIGAVVLSNRAVFDKLGPWDERFFLYYEDSDICLRAWQMGIQVLVDGRRSWIHGWARETSGFKIAPWKREVASAIKFYSRYPALLLPRGAAVLVAPHYARLERRVFA